MSQKKLVGWAIIVVAAIAAWTWWKSRKVTAPVASSTSSGTTAPPSLGATGTELQFLGQLPGLNFGN